MADVSDKSPVPPTQEYLPIEFFLANIHDYNMTSWISDQTACLRAVFKLYECHKQTSKDVVFAGDARIEIIRNSSESFEVKSDNSVHQTSYETQATCLHLKDGTAVIFLCIEDTLTGYHFCFEDLPEETFQAMVSGH